MTRSFIKGRRIILLETLVGTEIMYVGTISVRATRTPVHEETSPGTVKPKSGDLTNFENQLDNIEKNFWIAALLSNNDPFSHSFERKLSDLVNLSRKIQSRFFHLDMDSRRTNMLQRISRIRAVLQRLAGKTTIPFCQLRNSSRRSYGLFRSNKSKDDYYRWLENTMTANINSFSAGKTHNLSVTVSDFYMAVKELCVEIVELSETELFEENPQLGVPDCNSVVTGSPRVEIRSCKCRRRK